MGNPSRKRAIVATLVLAFIAAGCSSSNDASPPPTFAGAPDAGSEIPSADSFADGPEFFAFAAERDGYASAEEFADYFFSLEEDEQNRYIETVLALTTDQRAAFVDRMTGGGEVTLQAASFSISGPNAVMTDVPGSLDDESNLEAARLVRQAGLATHVPADGIIASGGVDFYLASATRTYEAGAQFGVHSWATTDGTSGADVPRDDPDHQFYLDYYAEISIDADFYWFTLEAAPADSIHFMTDAELSQYGFGPRY